MLSSQEWEEPGEGAGKQGLVGIGVGKGQGPTRHREQHMERCRGTEDRNSVGFSPQFNGLLWGMCQGR